MIFKTGSKNLDKLLHGGFPGGCLSLVAGETATGRTTLALSASASAIKRKQTVLFFDCECSVSFDRLLQLGLSPSETQQRFNTVHANNLETGLQAAVEALKAGVNLVVMDSPNLLESTRRNVSLGGIFANWIPKVQQALKPENAILLTWQLKRAATRGELKTGNFGFPMALAHGAATATILTRYAEEDGVEATVTKNRTAHSVGDEPSCILKFADKWLLKDVRMANQPLNREKIPTRFDREDPI